MTELDQLKARLEAHQVRDQLRADNERLRKEVEGARKLLTELTATVLGECPSLLNGEDASDNLAIDIDQWLEETK